MLLQGSVIPHRLTPIMISHNISCTLAPLKRPVTTFLWFEELIPRCNYMCSINTSFWFTTWCFTAPYADMRVKPHQDDFSSDLTIARSSRPPSTLNSARCQVHCAKSHQPYCPTWCQSNWPRVASFNCESSLNLQF